MTRLRTPRTLIMPIKKRLPREGQIFCENYFGLRVDIEGAATMLKPVMTRLHD